MSLPAAMTHDNNGGGSGLVEPEPPPAAEEVILATAGYDHCIKFWVAHTGQCVFTLQHPDSQVNAMEISPDGLLLAACGYQRIRMFDVNSNKPNPVVNYEGVSKNVMTVSFQEDGKWMYTCGEDCTVRIWDLRMKNLQCRRVYQAGSPVNSARLHPNQQEILLGDQSGRLHIWNIRADVGECITPEPGASIQHVDIDPTGSMFAAVVNTGNCYIGRSDHKDWTMFHDFKGEVDLKKISAHSRYALKCRFSPDSKALLTSSADQTAKLWSTSKYDLLSKYYAENQRWVWDVAFSADSQYMFTASSDCVARLWSIQTQEVKRVYKEKGHTKAVTCLAFRDGQVN